MGWIMRLYKLGFSIFLAIVCLSLYGAVKLMALEGGTRGWELEYSADVAAEKLMKSVVFVETRFDKPRNEDAYAPWAYFRGGRPLMGLYGSGFIYKDPKYVITVPFILENAEYIRVVTWDGKSFPAKLKGKNEAFKTAVLEVQWGRSYQPQPAQLADPTRIRIGQPVAICGRSEQGRDYICTVGVISAIRKEIPTSKVPTEQYIQFDAAYSLPMMGGPLANADGEVVGIVYGTVTEFGGTNVNLAVPVDDLAMAADRIIAGKTQNPWVGVEVLALTSQIRQLNKVPDRITGGLFISYVEPGSPADLAGLRAGDLILAVNDAPIAQEFDLKSFLRRVEIGQVIRVRYWRFTQGVSDNPRAREGDIFETIVQVLPYPEEKEEKS